MVTDRSSVAGSARGEFEKAWFRKAKALALAGRDELARDCIDAAYVHVGQSPALRKLRKELEGAVDGAAATAAAPDAAASAGGEEDVA
jgi:hypothetical protein